MRTRGKPTPPPPPANNTREQDHGERHERWPRRRRHPLIMSPHARSPRRVSPTPQFKHDDGVDHDRKTVSPRRTSRVPNP
jgi:hypothetical protein